MNDVREGIQQEAQDAYLLATSKGRLNAATVIVGTGGGKSKIAIDLIKKLEPSNILLLTNSENLRDSNWKAEFEKFGADWGRVTSECYQTVHKWVDTHYDLVVADEIDFAMSPVYSNYFKNNKWGYLLGLTGFSTEDKKGLLQLYAPICFEASTQEMQEEGLLNKSEFIFVGFDLGIAKTIEVKMKKGGHFYASENDQYKYYDDEFRKAIAVKSALETKSKLFPTPENITKFNNMDWRFKMAAIKRKQILNNLNSSVKVVRSLVEEILKNPDNKVLIYSALTSQADKFGYPTYHGDADVSVLDKLNSGEIRALAVCKKLNRGMNLNGVNYIIKESFDGSETDFQQQHGRVMRLRPDQTAKIIVLVPFYKQLLKTEEKGFFGSRMVSKMVRTETQAAKWTEKMMASFDLKNTSVKNITMTSEWQIPLNTTL